MWDMALLVGAELNKVGLIPSTQFDNMRVANNYIVLLLGKFIGILEGLKLWYTIVCDDSALSIQSFFYFVCLGFGFFF